jgi:hypothetical protein
MTPTDASRAADAVAPATAGPETVRCNACGQSHPFVPLGNRCPGCGGQAFTESATASLTMLDVRTLASLYHGYNSCDGTTREAVNESWRAIEAKLAHVATLEARLRDAERDRDALREVVENFALVERHTETRAHGQSDLYRMPYTRASWFDSRDAAVTDWLRATRAAPRADAGSSR